MFSVIRLSTDRTCCWAPSTHPSFAGQAKYDKLMVQFQNLQVPRATAMRMREEGERGGGGGGSMRRACVCVFVRVTWKLIRCFETI